MRTAEVSGHWRDTDISYASHTMHRAIPVAAALLAGALGLLGFFRNIELQTYDLRVAATARPAAPAGNIVLVAIDDDSIRRMEPLVGRWPWPRLVHSMVIDYLAAAGAKVIGYDILFAERDIRKFMVGDTEWTGEESDAALVDSTRKAGNVVHIAEASSLELADASRALKENLDAPALNLRVPSDGCAEPRPRVTPPFPALADASRGIGHSLFAIDSNGAVRRFSPVVRVGDRAIGSFAVATAIAADTTPALECTNRRDGALHDDDSVARRGRQPQRATDVHVVLVLRPVLFTATDSRRAEARHRSSALQGSHRHRRRDRRGTERSVHDAVPAGRDQRTGSACEHRRRVSGATVD